MQKHESTRKELWARRDLTVPDTIITWVMQAVAIKHETGLGLTTPLRIVGKHFYFTSLKIPCSAVKRGEQVALLATDVNYHEKEMRVKLCLTGNKDFCSIVANNKLELYDANRV